MSEKIIELLMNMEREIGEIKATGVSTLEQAKKTNGRVTCLEESNLKLSNIVSRHNGVLLKWEECETEDKRDNKQLKKRVYWALGIALLVYIFKDIPQLTGFLTKLI
jgi:hypothetical protein